MDWQAALRARLLADGALDVLIDGELHWGEVPQKSPRPNVAMLLISDGREQHLKGYWSIQPARVQIDVRADDYATAQAVKEAFLAAAIPGHTGNGHVFSRGMVELPPRDIVERVSAGDGRNKSVFRVSMDVTFHHAPTEDAS